MSPARARNEALLSLDRVGSERIEISAAGTFTSSHVDRVADRLDLLLACGVTNLSIDMGSVTLLDDRMAELFAATDSRLKRAGGTLQLINVRPGLAHLLDRDLLTLANSPTSPRITEKFAIGEPPRANRGHPTRKRQQ